MAGYDILGINGTDERGYYVDGVRYDRAAWRAALENDIMTNERAVAYVEMQIKGLEGRIEALNSMSHSIATFPISKTEQRLFRNERYRLQQEMADAKSVLDIGKMLVSQFKEMLED